MVKNRAGYGGSGASGEGLRLERGGWDKPPIEGKTNGTFRRIAVGSKERQSLAAQELV